ncbi:MAG: acetyl-CoA carboxylase biotin carboxyl carrier protein [Leptolyngbya sp. PLA3]|nr:MAG: acetyl-CoA carboxylase biotin carboxyl carrier protein [Cyanobacteria bacterium CYA]MCE7969444.1 acetyl-CoA carboxylase biotin carboxyl carrier protein [Leptolyngbya sp. PL-A3]
MIDIRKLKELVRLMVENELTELDLEDQQETVKIRRGAETQTVVNHQPVIYQGVGGPAPATAARPRPAAAEDFGAEPSVDGTGTDEADDNGDLVAIESPMVGTFYSSPNPDADPYVAVGSAVSDDSIVCLVEAMKVFNEIKAGVSGKIERQLVKDGEAVEFGQKLYLVRPN